VLDRDRFDAVLVQGDTASTVAGALVAYWSQLPLVHLEAGLRTGDLQAPFPEEGNRRLVAPLADLHLAPTPGAAANLCREGVDPARIEIVGNTAIDAVRHTAAGASRYPRVVPAGFARHVLVTCHRRESWGAGIRSIGTAVGCLARANPDTAFVVVTHPNPRVRRELAEGLEGVPNAFVLAALAYGPFVRVLAEAHVVLTDSGGIQEEAPALDVPVLVLRDVTERPEAVAAGCAHLVGTSTDAIVHGTQTLLDDDALHRRMAQARCPFGDGTAASRSVELVTRHLSCCGTPG
jgi:UDP-N-acetylglucosamine 2-epimerase (non-hydrolysing)